MAEAGVVLTLKDKASNVLKAIGGNAKRTFGGMREQINKIPGALGKVGIALAVLNQVVGLFDNLKNLVVERFMRPLVDASLQYRKANDPVLKQLKEFKEGFSILAARIGDILIPIIQGIADVMRPVLKQWADFFAANRKLVGLKIEEYLLSIGNALIGSVGKAALIVSKIWTGWALIVDVVKLAVNKQFEVILTGLSEILKGFQYLAKFLPGPVAAAIEGTASAVAGLRDEFASSADKNAESLTETMNAQAAFEKQLNSFETQARKVWGDVAVAMQKRVQSSIGGTNKTLEQQAAILEKQRAMVDLVAARWIEGVDAQNAALKRAADERIKAWEEEQTRAKELANMQKTIANSVANAFGNAFAQIASGSESAGMAMMQAMISAAQTAVNAAAASAAAQAAFSQAGIPILGPALAAAASATVFGLVKAFLAKIPQAESGMRIKGGLGGIDSVPVMMQQGEVALSTRQTDLLDRLVSRLERSPGTGGAGGPTVVQNFRVTSVGASVNADIARATNQANKLMRRQAARGF